MKTVIVQLDRVGETGLRSEEFPSLRDQRINRVIAVVLIIGSLVLMSLPQTSGWLRLMYALAGAAVITVFLQKLWNPRVFLPGILRVSQASTPLRLVPFRGGRIVAVAATLGTLVVGSAAAALAVQVYVRDPVAFSFFSLPVRAWVGMAVAVALSVFMVRVLLQERRAGSGIELSEWGVVAAGDGDIGRIGWDMLFRATIMPDTRRGPQLLLHGRDRRTVGIPPRFHCSDPMVVAALIHFYRDHPEERHLLATPERAVERFRASLI